MEPVDIARARARMNAALRAWFEGADYLEVETPILVPAPGMEPHIRAFETTLHLEELGAPPRRMWLVTSPEFAMKRLLAAGLPRIFQVTKVFRDEPPSSTHNPEFTMLELYRAPGDYGAIMDDLEGLLRALARAFDRPRLESGTVLDGPFERLTVREAFRRGTGVDVADHPPPDGAGLAAALGRPFASGTAWDDVFFGAFLDDVEPTLGRGRPTFLVDYPAHMAALSKVKADDARWAERFELYVDGLELANGFSELNDAAEQRRRFLEEQDERRRLGREVYPLDEAFLEAVGRMPDAGGVAVGLDRVLMLLTAAASIRDVLLFPVDGPAV